ncbi:MAG TPA: hypothetical protein VIM18_08465 [Solirubrobacteraceae bacterium]|jgi:hypothetical protein
MAEKGWGGAVARGFEVFGTFGVGQAATMEPPAWRWSDSPLGGTGPLAEPVPNALMGTGLVILPHVRQLTAGGGGLPSKHACPALSGREVVKRSSPAT